MMNLDQHEDESLIVLDDVILDNQDIIREYLTRGRHKNIDVFYLAQTFSKVRKQLVRVNTNFLCIFRQDDSNLKHIYSDFVGGDVSYENFKEISSKCWNEDYGFITLDLSIK